MRHVLDYYIKLARERLRQPSAEEVAKACGYSCGQVVSKHLCDLERLGYMAKVGRRRIVLRDSQGRRIAVMKYDTPTQPGFYWAKWKIADEGSSAETTGESWEVVEVFGNDMLNKDLRVFVGGEDKSQGIDNFFWGPSVGEPPRT